MTDEKGCLMSAEIPIAPTGPSLEDVCRIVGEVRELDGPADPDALLERDLGCSSFDMMVVVARIETELDVAVDFSALGDIETPRDLAVALG